jgi:membrane protein DedA with SNARE-associated domain
MAVVLAGITKMLVATGVLAAAAAALLVLPLVHMLVEQEAKEVTAVQPHNKQFLALPVVAVLVLLVLLAY